MKIKFFNYIISLLLVSSVICLHGCSDSSNYENEYHVYRGQGSGACLYDNMLYIKKDTSIYFYNLNNGDNKNPECVPLCSDPLCSHGIECPLFTTTTCLIIDEYETEKNNGRPIIYMTADDRLIRYDAAKNSSETIMDNIPGAIEEMWVYNDRIYYILKTFGDDPYSMNCITKDGKNTYILNHASKKYKIYIAGFWNERIYYYDDTMQYYYTDIDLKNEQLLMETKCYPSAIVYDKNLYFCDDSQEHQLSNSKYSYYSCTIYKLDLENIESGKKEVITGVLAAPCPYMFPAGNKLLYNIADPYKTGEYEYLDYEGNIQEIDVFSNGSNKIYSYNMDTGEISVLIENTGANLGLFLGANDRYIAISYIDYDWDKTVSEMPGGGNIAYDFINNKKFLLK